MLQQIPSYYSTLPERAALREANESTTRPRDHSVDCLPFSALGGRRFEILSYLLAVSLNPEPDLAVTLVKASGDQGRDVLVHRQGVLQTVIQCKNLEAPFTRPALIRELVKFALHDRLEHFVPDVGCVYEVWAPAGFTQPADSLFSDWPNGLDETEVRDAFLACRRSYAAFEGLEWDDCAACLLNEFPRRVKIVRRDGLLLSASVRGDPLIHSRFFEATVVLRKDDVEAILEQKLRSLGIGRPVDADVDELLAALQAIPKDQRVYTGPFIFGLSPRHIALLSIDEKTQLLNECLRPTFSAVGALSTALPRHAQTRIDQVTSGMKYGSASFKYVLQRAITVRLLGRLGKLATPTSLHPKRPLAEFDELSLIDVVDHFVTATWDELQTMLSRYDPAQHLRGSDPWLRARIAQHLLLGIATRTEMEAAMRADVTDNWTAIDALDRELCELVPARVLVLSDTRHPNESEESRTRLQESVKALEDARKSRDAEVAAKDQATNALRGAPTLREVTWSALPYEDLALFRGYHAALVFRGHNFADSLEHTERRIGEGLPAGQKDYFWHRVNTVRPNYAELSTGGDDLEGPLSWRGYEFRVRNSSGQESDWVPFTYPFDESVLLDELSRCEREGLRLRANGNLDKADDLLRRAYVFADRIFGQKDSQTRKLWDLREENLDDLLRSRLRFAVGSRVNVIKGTHEGCSGTITNLLLRHHHAYVISDMDGVSFQAADDEVESAAN